MGVWLWGRAARGRGSGRGGRGRPDREGILHDNFTPVYVHDTLTLDFGDRDQFEGHHFCFRVSDDTFDANLGRIRAARIPYRGHPRGKNDMRIDPCLGGRNPNWDDAGGHLRELLTVSDAGPDSPPLIAAG